MADQGQMEGSERDTSKGSSLHTRDCFFRQPTHIDFKYSQLLRNFILLHDKSTVTISEEWQKFEREIQQKAGKRSMEQELFFTEALVIKHLLDIVKNN